MLQGRRPPEYYVNGIARIEDGEGVLRFTFYQTRKPAADWPGPIGRVEEVVLIMPIDAVCRAAIQAAEAVRDVEARRFDLAN